MNNTFKCLEKGIKHELLDEYLDKLINELRIRNFKDLLHFAEMFNYVYMNSQVSKDLLKQKISYKLKLAKPSYCNSKGAIINGALAKAILEEIPTYVKGNMIFMYNPEKGIYEYKDTREQQKIYLDRVILDEDIDSSKAKKFAETISILADNYKELCFYENRYINCLNGIIDIETNKLLEYTPDIKVDTQFNANYICGDSWKEAYEQSKFKDFLENILDKDTILTLQEAWGVMLAPNSSKIQQCFIYLGEGSNGKSSLFDIQESLVGDKDRNICGISLGSFQDEFILSMAEGRRVNIVRDDKFDNKKKIGGVFKSVVCGEEVTVNKKGKNHVRLKFNIAWYYGLNRLAITDDKSHGFFRRPIIIPFKVRFGKTQEEVDRGDADKLAIPGITDDIIKNELDICFNWALEGLMRLKSNGWIITQSEASLKEMEEYKEESDTAYAFYKEKLIKRKGNKINAKQLYDSYKDWCLSESLSPMNPTQFGRQMASFGHKKYKSMGKNVFPDIDYNSFILVEGSF